MKKHTKALTVLLCLLLTASTARLDAQAVSQTQIDALSQQRSALRAEREAMQPEIDELKERKADILEQKAALDSQNEIARQEIELIDEQVGLYTALIAEKAAEVELAVAREEEQLARYRARVRAMEENGAFSYLAILFSSRSLGQLLSNIDLISEIMDADKRCYDRYISAREETERVKAEYQQTLSELTERQSRLLAEKSVLEGKIADAWRMIGELESDIDAYKKAWDENEQAESLLNTQIADLTAQLKAQEEAARKASETAQQPYAGPGSASTGTYLWPCPSCHTVGDGFGKRWHPIYLTYRMHYGVDIPAQEGAEIVAADGGTVSVATKNSSAGNYVVIYHSGGVTTTYMHMSSMAVSAGDTVAAGQVIGYVGSTGMSTGPHLHFEVAVDGVRTDPLGYVRP